MKSKIEMHPYIFNGQVFLTLNAFALIPVLVSYTKANVFEIGIFRITISIIGLIILSHFKVFKKVNQKDFFYLMGSGIVFGLHWILYFIAIKMSGASIAILSLSTFGIFLLIFGIIFLKESINTLVILAVFLSFCGNLLIPPEISFGNQGFMGMLIGVLSGFFYAFMPLFHKRNNHIPMSTKAFYQFSFGAIPFLFFYSKLSFAGLGQMDWYSLLTLSIFCTLMAHTFWVKITGTVSSMTAGLFYYLSVVIALVFSVLLLDEEMTVSKIIGASLIIFGNIIGLLSRKNRSLSTLKKSNFTERE